MRKYLEITINISLVIASMLFSLFVLEMAARIFLDPVDYLDPVLYSDYRLKHVIKPHSAGHDEWGFRNKRLPDTVDIVALGDSMTYGVNELSKYSWPSWLRLKANKGVYNMGLGGYGPVQYYYLLKEKALPLKPKVIIVGLYYGNDLMDAYRMIYTYQYWNKFKDKKVPYRNEHLVGDPPHLLKGNLRGVKKIRVYLAHISVVYRIIVHSFIGNLFRRFEAESQAYEDKKYIVLHNEDRNIETSFIDGYRLRSMDLRKEEVREGLRKTLFLIREMKEICLKNNTTFIVLRIPTKETVYAKYFDRRNDSFKSLIEAADFELKIHNEVKEFTDKNQITYIDSLPYLLEEVEKPYLYHVNTDSHPRRDGHAAIASSLADYLRDMSIGFIR